MNRADLLAHAQAVFVELAAETGIALAEDSEGQDGTPIPGISRQLDAAARDLGDDTSNTAAGEALIEYHVLRRMRYAVAARVDFDATAVKTKRSQIYNQIDSLIEAAIDACASAGHAIAQTGGSKIVDLNLDYLEPEPAI